MDIPHLYHFLFMLTRRNPHPRSLFTLKSMDPKMMWNPRRWYTSFSRGNIMHVFLVELSLNHHPNIKLKYKRNIKLGRLHHQLKNLVVGIRVWANQHFFETNTTYSKKNALYMGYFVWLRCVCDGYGPAPQPWEMIFPDNQLGMEESPWKARLHSFTEVSDTIFSFTLPAPCIPRICVEKIIAAMISPLLARVLQLLGWCFFLMEKNLCRDWEWWIFAVSSNTPSSISFSVDPATF